MQIVTHAPRLTLSPALRNHIERRLETAIKAFESRVRRISVRLIDLNGPKGGIDTRCRIQAQSTRGEELVVSGTGENGFAAVSYAVDRLHRLMRRRLGDRKAGRRHS
ncbi:MAG: HPF/RaiA family ribosome-associated protein [Planctomycetota bacterium]